MRKVLHVIVCAMLFGNMLWAMSSAESEIKIGVAGPYTGDLASYGIPPMRAAELAVSKYNEAGGINGTPITLLTEDEMCEASLATNVAAKLVGNGVVAVVGHICSSATLAALSIYNDEGVIAISPASTNPDLTLNFPNFFRTIAADNKQAELQVEYLRSIGARNIAILHDKGDYGRGLAEFAQGFIEEGGQTVVLFEGITPGALDYTAIVLKISQSGADAVVFGGYHPEASKIITLMRSQNLTIPFISGDGIKDDSFIDIAKGAAEGVIATGPSTVDSPALDEALAAHQSEYGEAPGPFFKEGYSATQIILQAIEKVGAVEYDALRDVLLSETFDTVLGELSFDSNGDIIGTGFSVYIVEDGVFIEKQL